MLKEVCDEIYQETTRCTTTSLDRSLTSAHGTNRGLSRLRERGRSSASSVTTCPYKPGRRMYRELSGWGSLQFYNETSSLEEHELRCGKKCFDRDTNSHTLGVAYYGLTRLLNHALILSITFTAGAGGYSISPSFRYYPTVNEKTAPAFRLVKRMHRFINGLQLGHYPSGNPSADTCVAEYHRVFRIGIDHLSTLYRRGISSPADLTSNNVSILHCRAFLVRVFLPSI